MTLESARIGDKYQIVEIDFGHGSGQRLMVMGILPGESIKVVQVAPAGDPFTVETRGSHLSLRRADAAAILVKPQ